MTKIVLLDGEELTQLMIDHDLGVTTQRTYAVKRIDSDFFVKEYSYSFTNASLIARPSSSAARRK